MEFNKFSIEIDGEKYDAVVIMNFELYGECYCIYGVESRKGDYQIYCGCVIDHMLVPIKDDKDRDLVHKIAAAFINVFEEEKNHE